MHTCIHAYRSYIRTNILVHVYMHSYKIWNQNTHTHTHTHGSIYTYTSHTEDSSSCKNGDTSTRFSFTASCTHILNATVRRWCTMTGARRGSFTSDWEPSLCFAYMRIRIVSRGSALFFYMLVEEIKNWHISQTGESLISLAKQLPDKACM
jgi:hypothetical protein